MFIFKTWIFSPSKIMFFFLSSSSIYFLKKYNTIKCIHFKCSAWCALTNVNTGVTTSQHNQDIECFHQLTKFPVSLLSQSLSLPLLRLRTPVMSSLKLLIKFYLSRTIYKLYHTACTLVSSFFLSLFLRIIYSHVCL